MRRPAFWDEDGFAPRLLSPLSAPWIAAGRWRRAAARPVRARAPVICVGNATVGGGGKTPAAAALAEWLAARGWRPHILSRGYGGRLGGPLKVDPERHVARDVGDEPLVLARRADVWIGADRVRSARRAADAGADILVMDDGLQNPSLAKDLSILMVDGSCGFGNGRVVPAGPLREPADDAAARCRAVAIVGEDRFRLAERLAGGGRAILRAALRPTAAALAFRGEPVFAFAGIARPGKFFETLKELGAVVLAARSFPDHRVLDPATVGGMFEEAHGMGARLVTTEKDWMRLDPETRPLAEPVPVELEFRDPEALDGLLSPLASRPGP